MYQIKETAKEAVVKFTSLELRHAPSKTFNFKSYGGKKKALAAAEQYVDSLIDLYNQTKNLSAARNLVPRMSDDKVRILIDRPNNKTGVVGVYLEHTYDRLKRKHPYAYVSNYTINGKQKLIRFPLSKFGSPEAAFKAAVQHRLFSINVNKNWLDA